MVVLFNLLSCIVLIRQAKRWQHSTARLVAAVHVNRKLCYGSICLQP
jgi:hypothetical protein